MRIPLLSSSPHDTISTPRAPWCVWHLTSRGNERRDIFHTDRDRSRFLDILAGVVATNHWLVAAYVLMSNHYHLLLETPLPTLSSGAKRLNERYAQYVNAEHKRVGHLFQGRFKAILVEREAHYLELVRYIVLNPVRAGIVRFPGDYEWSSYRGTAGLSPLPRWLAVDDVLAQFGAASRAERCARYRKFVADGRGASYAPWEQLIGQIYLGGSEFCERMQTLVGAKRDSRAYPEPQRRVVRPSFEAIVARVTEHFGLEEAQLRGRSQHPARKAAALLLSYDAGVPFATIGDWMGITGQAAAYLARAATELERLDETFRATLARVRRDLEPLGASSERGLTLP